MWFGGFFLRWSEADEEVRGYGIDDGVLVVNDGMGLGVQERDKLGDCGHTSWKSRF